QLVVSAPVHLIDVLHQSGLRKFGHEIIEALQPRLPIRFRAARLEGVVFGDRVGWLLRLRVLRGRWLGLAAEEQRQCQHNSSCGLTLSLHCLPASSDKVTFKSDCDATDFLKSPRSNHLGKRSKPKELRPLQGRGLEKLRDYRKSISGVQG